MRNRWIYRLSHKWSFRKHKKFIAQKEAMIDYFHELILSEIGYRPERYWVRWKVQIELEEMPLDENEPDVVKTIDLTDKVEPIKFRNHDD